MHRLHFSEDGISFIKKRAVVLLCGVTPVPGPTVVAFRHIRSCVSLSREAALLLANVLDRGELIWPEDVDASVVEELLVSGLIEAAGEKLFPASTIPTEGG